MSAPASPRHWGLASDDVLRDPVYRRVFTSVLLGALGGQITLLALPLTAALLLHATPAQIGWLTALETLPFALLSLPVGVWLDRVRKLPVYIAGELVIAAAVVTVPLAWWLGVLTLPWLAFVGFVIGCVHTASGSAGQIVLTQIVPREKLVQAYARNALAGSTAEVVGPGAAGALIKLLGAPFALVADAVMLLASAAVLRRVRAEETLKPRDASGGFVDSLREGLRFVRAQRLLVVLAAAVGLWQFAHHAAMVVQVLHAVRALHLDEQAVGLAYIGVGLGTLAGGLAGDRVSDRFGPGRTLALGLALTALGWSLPMLAGSGRAGIVAYVAMLLVNGAGAVLVFINFIALRQAVTPPELLGRMTATMRWLILLPGVPGALAAGWLADRFGLPAAFALASTCALAAAVVAASSRDVWRLRELPAVAKAVTAPPSEG